MVKTPTRVAAMLALASLAQSPAAAAPPSRVVEVTLPRAASPKEAVDLTIQVGVIPKGTEIDIATPSGELIGTVSPFAIRPGQPAGTYVFALPPNAIENGHVFVSLSIRRPGEPARPPTPDEVPKVAISFTRIAP